jgi:nucleoside-diphosphate-sugar epimerase
MHSLGHEVHTWTRSERSVPWTNNIKLDSNVKIEFDFLFIASGGARPGFGNFQTEFASTYRLVSKFMLGKETKIIYISSGAVYGDCAEPMSETSQPNASTEYGLAKLLTENELVRSFKESLTILRVGNIIDDKQPYGIVSHLMKSIERGVFEVFGESMDCRDYLVVDDFLSCIQRLTRIDRLPGVINIGSGKSISLAEISQMLEASLGDRIKIIWDQRRPGDISQTRLDVSLMRQHLQKAHEDPVQRMQLLISRLT